MSYNNSQDFSKDPSYVHASNVVNRINKMLDNKEAEDWPRYWRNFHSCGTLLAPYLDMETKRKLQDGYDKLEKAIREIKKTNTNEKARENIISALRTEFALTHEILLTDSLGTLDIVKKVEDGEIRMDNYELEELEDLVRKTKSNVDINRKLKESEQDVDTE